MHELKYYDKGEVSSLKFGLRTLLHNVVQSFLEEI